MCGGEHSGEGRAQFEYLFYEILSSGQSGRNEARAAPLSVMPNTRKQASIAL